MHDILIVHAVIDVLTLPMRMGTTQQSNLETHSTSNT